MRYAIYDRRYECLMPNFIEFLLVVCTFAFYLDVNFFVIMIALRLISAFLLLRSVFYRIFLLLLFSCLKHPFVANISNVLIECLRFLSIRIFQPNIIVNFDVVITSLLPFFHSKIFLVQTMMDFLLLLYFYYIFALLIAS